MRLPFFVPAERANALRMMLLQAWLQLTAKEMDRISPEQMGKLTPLLDFLFEETASGTTIATQLTATPLPEIYFCPSGMLHGPANAFSNLTFYEWIKAESAFAAFCENKNPAQLHRLIALLWRPAKPATSINVDTLYGGDIRLPLRPYEATVNLRAGVIASDLPEWKQHLILHWYTSCRQRCIVERWPILFDAPNDDTPPSKFGLAGVLLEVAGTKFGTVDQTADTPLFTILLHLAMEENKRQEQEREMRRQQRAAR